MKILSMELRNSARIFCISKNSAKRLYYEYLVAKIGVGTAEKKPKFLGHGEAKVAVSGILGRWKRGRHLE